MSYLYAISFNYLLKTYVIEYIGKEKIEEKIPFLVDLVEKLNARGRPFPPLDIGYDAEKALRQMDTEKSKKSIGEIKCWFRLILKIYSGYATIYSLRKILENIIFKYNLENLWVFRFL